MSTKKVDIWDRGSDYWHEKVTWNPGQRGHLERRIELLREENLQRVEYDGTVYWDNGVEIQSIQSLQDFLETREAYRLSEIDKVITVRFSVSRRESTYDWKARR